ncbi:MAG: MucB/RseB C-terminal domain-containing protein [Gammaproteobacteria bacterium]
MSSLFHKLAIFLALVVGFGQVAASPAMDWVGRMSNAMRNLSYQGNFVYIHENQLESMSIFHIKNESGESERLLSLNGEAREVIRDNKNLTCIWPSSRKVVVDNSRQNTFSPLFIPDDIVRIGQHYEMSMAGEGRVANHDAVIVHIVPKDEFRYGLKLWVNADNGLLLKSNLINERNEVVEQVMFTNIELLSEIEQTQMFKLPEIDKSFSMVRYHSGDAVETVEADMTWQFTNLPDGFRKESALKRMVGDTGRFVQQMVYTDGLASLSVFIEKQTTQTAQGETSMGAVNGFIFLIDNYSVTAIGEVPAVTVRQVAESVSFKMP